MPSAHKIKILIIDDEAPIREVLKMSLEDEGYEVSLAENGEEGLKQLKSVQPDLAFLDVWMPGKLDGIAVLEQAMAKEQRTQFVIMSGHGTIETAVKAVRLGAWDFVEKPLSIDKVNILINNIVNFQLEQKEKQELLKKLRQNIALIGSSEPLKTLKQMIARAAPSPSWVVVTGEKGTGKELIAQNIHYLSDRASRPFVELHCGSVAKDLIDYEIFGYEAEAFPGADAQKRGLLEVADGGTLFLDEIGELPPKTQKKLLGFLHDQYFQREGGQDHIRVNTRLVLSLQEPLAKGMSLGTIDADFGERLKSFQSIEAPTLRARKKEDLFELIEHFSTQYIRATKDFPKVWSEPAREALLRYEWLGNVRELRNFVERIYILTPHEEVDVQDLRFAGLPTGESSREVAMLSFKDARAHFEREYLIAKIAENEGNISRTAEAIGLERSYLYRKMKNHGIEV